MEDILASIRRILSEDEVPAHAGEHPAGSGMAGSSGPNAGGTGGDDGVLVLDEAMMVEAPAHSAAAPPEQTMAGGTPDAPHTPTAQVPATAFAPEPAATAPMQPAPAAMPVPEPTPAHVPEPESSSGSLLNPESQAAASSAVGSLLRTLSSERATAVHRGGPTIEDLVREEIRPLLKGWLDQHLAPMVERLVRSEIERVTRSAGS